jgi:hypothetical protein
MRSKLSLRFEPLSPTTLGASIGLGACAVICLAPVVLALVGVSAATAVVCNVSEAVPFVLTGGAAGAGAVGLFRRRVAAKDCGCAAAGTVEGESDVPIACDLSVFTVAERREHFERSRRVFSCVERLSEEADGFTFTLRATPGLGEEVSLWAKSEQRCCPFFRFDVREAAENHLVVRVSGPGAAKDILRAGLEENGLVNSGARAR